jgi:predicted transcriptional regulator
VHITEVQNHFGLSKSTCYKIIRDLALQGRVTIEQGVVTYKDILTKHSYENEARIIKKLLKNGSVTTMAIQKRLKAGRTKTIKILNWLTRNGEIKRLTRGVYTLNEIS